MHFGVALQENRGNAYHVDEAVLLPYEPREKHTYELVRDLPMDSVRAKQGQRRSSGNGWGRIWEFEFDV